MFSINIILIAEEIGAKPNLRRQGFLIYEKIRESLVVYSIRKLLVIRDYAPDPIQIFLSFLIVFRFTVWIH